MAIYRNYMYIHQACLLVGWFILTESDSVIEVIDFNSNAALTPLQKTGRPFQLAKMPKKHAILTFIFGKFSDPTSEGHLDCHVLRAPQYLNPALAIWTVDWVRRGSPTCWIFVSAQFIWSPRGATSSCCTSSPVINVCSISASKAIFPLPLLLPYVGSRAVINRLCPMP